jgi:hypothetical protein
LTSPLNLGLNLSLSSGLQTQTSNPLLPLSLSLSDIQQLILHLLGRQEVQKFHHAPSDICIGCSSVRNDNPGMGLLFG